MQKFFYLAEIAIGKDIQYQISPGTKASREKMEKKLAFLRARDNARKEALNGLFQSVFLNPISLYVTIYAR